MITLAQHLAAHWLRNSITDDTDHDDNDWSTYCQCGYRIATTTAADVEALHREHVAATWQQARTITTIAQLDALPVGTVVRDHEADIMVYGPTGEGESAWWYDGDPYRANEVDLPALVVWRPDGGDQ